MRKKTEPHVIKSGLTHYVNPTGPAKGKGKRNGSTNRLCKWVFYKGKWYLIRTSNVPAANFTAVARQLLLDLHEGMIHVPGAGKIKRALIGSQVGTALAKRLY